VPHLAIFKFYYITQHGQILTLVFYHYISPCNVRQRIRLSDAKGVPKGHGVSREQKA